MFVQLTRFAHNKDTNLYFQEHLSYVAHMLQLEILSLVDQDLLSISTWIDMCSLDSNVRISIMLDYIVSTYLYKLKLL